MLGMYINKLFISNFRKFDEIGTTIALNNGINVVMGENNVGKSALIDAIRLILSYGQYRRKIYMTPEDFHINKYGERATEVRIDLFLNELSEEQGTAFYLLTNGTDVTTAEIHLRYTLQKDSKGNDKVKEYLTGGSRNTVIPPEIFENINVLFLPALRDAESDLKPSRSSQLASILYSVADTDDEKKRVLQALITANETLMGDPTIKSLKGIINKNLNLIEKEELQQNVEINLLAPSFNAIASSLDVWYQVEHDFVKMDEEQFCEMMGSVNISKNQLKGMVIRLDDKKVEIHISKMKSVKELEKLYIQIVKHQIVSSVSLKQNGLGYNNILSMAASLGDLQRKPINEEMSILLVEEPEAHLHPQLLDLLFNFFKESDFDNKIQIVMTSHSPTLVSKADIDSLLVLYKGRLSGEAIESVALSNSNLSLEEKEDLRRYLDVTKSQLFFAKRILFVEGISEAILITEFAKMLKKPFDKYSVEIVNIGGVAFEAFSKLFIKKQDKDYMKIPCVIISDNDKCTNFNDPYLIDKKELTYTTANITELRNKIKNGTPSFRASKLLGFSGENIKVELAEKTLEYELAKYNQNNAVLLEILEGIHPTITKDIRLSIDNGEQQENIAIRIWLAIRDSKGIFAQKLAGLLAKKRGGERMDIDFVVPKYIQDAIDFIID